MNKHKSNKIKENSNTVRHLIMGQIITTQNLVAIKVVRHAGQWQNWWLNTLRPEPNGHQCAHNILDTHDDVIKWKYFPRYWPFVRGIHRSPVNSPHKGQWRGALMFSLICAWINHWVNNREAGDLRRQHAHYDVTVMFSFMEIRSFWWDIHWNILSFQ